MIKNDDSVPTMTTRTLTTPSHASESSSDAALVVLRWHRASAWAWMTDGQGPTSRFAGFVHLPDPEALPGRINALGWELVAVQERQRGLVEAEIRIPLPEQHPPNTRTA